MGKKAMDSVYYLLMLVILVAAVLFVVYTMFNESVLEDSELQGELNTFGIGGEQILVSATRTIKGSSALNAIDNDDSSVWDSGSYEPADIMIEFDSEKSAVGYTLLCEGQGVYGKVVFYDVDNTLILYDSFYKCGDLISRTFEPEFNMKRVVIRLRSSADVIKVNEFNVVEA